MSIIIKDTNNKVKIVYSKFTEETRFACNSNVSIINYVVELELKTGTYTNTEEFLNSFTEELNAVGITDNAKPEFTYTVENRSITLKCNSRYGFGFCYTPNGISNNIFFQNFPFLLESDFGSVNNKNKAQNIIKFVDGKVQQNYVLVSTCSSGNCQGYAGKIIIKYKNGTIGAVGEFPLGSNFITEYIKRINSDAMRVFGIKYNICEFFEAPDNNFEIAIMFRDIVKIYIPEALLNQLGFQKNNQVTKVNFATDSTLRKQFGGYANYETYYDCSKFIFNNVLICNMFTMLDGNIVIDNVSYIQNNSVMPKNPYCILTKIAKLVTGYTGVDPVGEITQASVFESTLMFTRDLSSRINYSIDSLTTEYYSIVFIKDLSQKGLKITINNYYNKPCVDPENIFAPTIVGQVSTAPCSNCMAGTMSRTCNIDYRFSEVDTSTCTVQYCQKEENPNGEIWSKTAAGETASISCPTNYKGNVFRTCDCSTVEWGDPDDSQCVRAECPADGDYPKTYAGVTVTLNCAANQNGKIERLCKSNGEWGNEVNRCEDNYCPAEDPFPKTLGGTTATLSCAANQDGSITRFCKNDGEWEEEINDDCVNNYCPAKFPYEETLGGTTVTRSCADNQRGKITRVCKNNGEWENEVNDCEYNYCPAENNFPKTLGGTIASISCGNNYSGSIKKLCKNDGNWDTSSSSSCSLTICEADSGFEDTPLGLTATKPCESGYRGQLTRLCNSDGNWGPIEGSCEEIITKCAADPVLGFDETPLGEIAYKSCDSPIQDGRVSRQCNMDGSWGPPDESSCVNRYCSAIGSFPKTIASSYAYLECPQGYEGSGISRYCNVNGKWEDQIESCTRIICSADSGFPDTNAGETAEKPCGPGYSGNYTRLCNLTGSWEDPIESCTRIICSADQGFNDTYAGETAVKSCGPGYSGNYIRLCDITGSWRDPANNCVANCPAIDSFPETIANSYAYLECPQGYEGSGISRYCNVNGEWEKTVEDCTRIVCSADSGFPATNAGETAEKPCGPGYTGNYTRLCDITGSWESTITNNCTQILYCPENKYKGLDWPRTEVGKTIELTCPNDSNVKVKRACLENQEWSETDPVTITNNCTQIICSADSGVSDTNAGETATKSCPEGYSGSVTRFCNLNGEWESENSSNCRIICSADQGFDDTYAGETAVKSCGSGYTGNYTRLCDITGSWRDPIDNCVANCPAVDNFPETNANNYARLDCPQGYEGLGISKYCNANGEWEETNESCTQVLYCPENKYKGLDWPRTEVGKTYELTCPNDSSIKVKRMCRVDQEWGETDPVNIPNTCINGSNSGNNSESSENNILLIIVIVIVVVLIIVIVIVIVKKVNKSKK